MYAQVYKNPEKNLDERHTIALFRDKTEASIIVSPNNRKLFNFVDLSIYEVEFHLQIIYILISREATAFYMTGQNTIRMSLASFCQHLVGDGGGA